MDNATFKRAHEICEADVQERPWIVRIDDSGFVTVVDANGMFVADFGSGSPAEARLTVEATDLLPRALAEIERLRALLGEAVALAEEANGDSSSCSYSVPVGDRLSEIAAAIGGDGV